MVTGSAGTIADPVTNRRYHMPNRVTLQRVQDLIDMVREQKPNDHSDLDRRYAITLTELEKIQVLLTYYLGPLEPPAPAPPAARAKRRSK